MPVIDTPPSSQTPVSGMVQASPDEQRIQNGDLQERVREILLKHMVQKTANEAEMQGIGTAVEIIDLQTNRPIVEHNADTEHFAASINKLPVSLLVLEDLRSGKLKWSQTLTWTTSDVRAGQGTYDQPGAPLSAPLKDVVYDLLNKSGNTAVRVLVNNALGGAEAVNSRWALNPELSHTYLQPLDANRFYLGNSTARDSLWAMGKLLDKQDVYARSMKRAMATNIYADFGVRSQLAGNEWIVLANKVGILDDATGDNRHDVGIIYNKRTHKSYGYSFMTTTPQTTPSTTPQAEQAVKNMGRYVLRFAGDKAQTQMPTPAPLVAPLHGNEQRMLY